MIVIKHQIEASDRAAHDIAEQLRHDHCRAMAVMDVDDLVRGVVGLFADIGRAIERHQNGPVPPTGGPSELDFEQETCDLHHRLGDTFGQVDQLIRTVEAWEYHVNEKAAFLDAWRWLRGMNSLSLDRVRSAVTSVARGEGQSLRAFRDESRAGARP